MVGVVHLLHEIGDGELKLVRPQPAGLVAVGARPWRGAEILQDVRGLRDQQPAGLEERRRERRLLCARCRCSASCGLAAALRATST